MIMTKTKKNFLIGFLMVLMALTLSFAFGINSKAKADTPNAVTEFKMVVGAQVKADAPSGLKFVAEIPEGEYSAEKKYGMLIIPNDYVELAEINISESENVVQDIIDAANEKDTDGMPKYRREINGTVYYMKAPTLIDDIEPKWSAENGCYQIEAGIVNIFTQNYNRPWFAVAYEKTENGEYVPCKQNDNIRSVGRVTSIMVNKIAIDDPSISNDDKLLYQKREEVFKSFIKDSVKNVMGEGFVYSANKFESAELNTETPLADNLPALSYISAAWTTSDPSIATVEDGKLITNSKQGVVTVTANYCNGEKIETFSVFVENERTPLAYTLEDFSVPSSINNVSNTGAGGCTFTWLDGYTDSASVTENGVLKVERSSAWAGFLLNPLNDCESDYEYVKIRALISTATTSENALRMNVQTDSPAINTADIADTTQWNDYIFKMSAFSESRNSNVNLNPNTQPNIWTNAEGTVYIADIEALKTLDYVATIEEINNVKVGDTVTPVVKVVAPTGVEISDYELSVTCNDVDVLLTDGSFVAQNAGAYVVSVMYQGKVLSSCEFALRSNSQYGEIELFDDALSIDGLTKNGTISCNWLNVKDGETGVLECVRGDSWSGVKVLPRTTVDVISAHKYVKIRAKIDNATASLGINGANGLCVNPTSDATVWHDYIFNSSDIISGINANGGKVFIWVNGTGNLYISEISVVGSEGAFFEVVNGITPSVSGAYLDTCININAQTKTEADPEIEQGTLGYVKITSEDAWVDPIFNSQLCNSSVFENAKSVTVRLYVKALDTAFTNITISLPLMGANGYIESGVQSVSAGQWVDITFDLTDEMIANTKEGNRADYFTTLKTRKLFSITGKAGEWTNSANYTVYISKVTFN